MLHMLVVKFIWFCLRLQAGTVLLLGLSPICLRRNAQELRRCMAPIIIKMEFLCGQHLYPVRGGFSDFRFFRS